MEQIQNYKIQTATSGTNTYYGFAPRGSLTSSAVWSIIRKDTNGSIDWAEGSDDFRFVWDDRATYTYK